MATRILWLSRHDLTAEQRADLARIYGDVEIHHVPKQVSSAADVVAEADAANADVLAVVLPPNILADLVNPRFNSRPVIRAKSSRVPTGNMVENRATGKMETEYRFQHAGWQRVLKIEIITEDL